MALTSPTSSGRSVGIVRSRTQVVEFSFLVLVDDEEQPTFRRTFLLQNHGQFNPSGNETRFFIKSKGSAYVTQPGVRVPPERAKTSYGGM
jgi:hypothetical protein